MNELERRQIVGAKASQYPTTKHETASLRQRLSHWVHRSKKEHYFAASQTMDKQLLIPALLLTVIGFVMVSSATMDTMAANTAIADGYYYPKRMLVFYVLGFMAMYLCLRLPTSLWHANSLLIFGLGLLGLLTVVVVGDEVNGAKRWLSIGGFSLQLSEFAKVALMVVMAGYIVRQQQNIRTSFTGFIFGMFFPVAYCAVLYFQSDLGAMVVLLGSVCGVFFLSGLQWRYIVVSLLALSMALTLLIVGDDYRLERLTTFVNPWADPFDTGYQIVQSQIALGQGGWFGAGLGDSVQKLYYLPESHNDFILSVITEEHGAVGAIVVMLLMGMLIYRGLRIGQQAEQLERFYAAYLSYGLSFIVAIQAIINISVNLRLMPNKGLTLPFVSYGGSSFLACCIILGILMRISIENRQSLRQQTHQSIDQQKLMPDGNKTSPMSIFSDARSNR